MIPLADCISDFSEKSLLLLLLKLHAGSPTGVHEQVDGSVASATSTNTFAAGDVVRLVAIQDSASIVFGAGPVGANNIYLAPDVPEYFSVNVATRIAVNGTVVDITVME